MEADGLRDRIAHEAARLLRAGRVSEFAQAKLKAARRYARGTLPSGALPTNREIRDRMAVLDEIDEGHRLSEVARDQMVTALRIMRLLRTLEPQLSVRPGEAAVQASDDICLDVAAGCIEDVATLLDAAGMSFCLACPPPPSARMRRVTTIHVHDRFNVQVQVRDRLALLPANRSHDGQRGVGIAALERLLDRDYPDLAIEEAMANGGTRDRFAVYRGLLLPLEDVRLDPAEHPEGDALFHSLQVFVQAREQLPYDEEFLLAALLHEVGQALDPEVPTAAGLVALGGYISPRTAWFIEHLDEAAALRGRQLGLRSRRRLERSDDFEELLILAQCDRQGRVRGAQVPEAEEALDELRELADLCGE